MPVLIFTPVQAPSAKKNSRGPLTVLIFFFFFFQGCDGERTGALSLVSLDSYRINLDACFSIRIVIIWLSIFTHIEIPPDDRKLTSLYVKYGEL